MRDADWADWRFIHTGDGFFDGLSEEIRAARRSIRIETYIFRIDPLTEKILAELGEARRRGLDVQLLVDGAGSYFWLEALTERCRRHDIDLRVWRPLPRGLGALRVLLLPLQFRFVRFLRRLNRRDHRKIALFDDETAFLGSMNFTQVHSERAMGAAAWRDSAVRLRGGSLPDVLQGFRLAWARARRLSLERLRDRRERRDKYDPRESLVRLNFRRADRRFLNRDLLRRLNRAEKRVWIVSAYFLPTRAVMGALIRAARRGVDVQVVIPGPSDVPAVKWAAAHASRRLLKAGVRLHEFQRSILHAKFLIIDDWATLGSTNLNHRSLFHDLESEAVFHGAAAVQDLAAQWVRDAAASYKLTFEALRDRSWPRRLLEGLAFRLRYFM